MIENRNASLEKINIIEENNVNIKDNYLHNPMELQRNKIIENIFKKYDEDNSSNILLESLEISEVIRMFQVNGINPNKKAIEKLFESVNPITSGSLSLEEFKKFSSSIDASKSIINSEFKELMKNIQNEYKGIKIPKEDEVQKAIIRKKKELVNKFENYKKKKNKNCDDQNDYSGIKIPQRKKIPFLPTNFNALMDHFYNVKQRKDLKEQIYKSVE